MAVNEDRAESPTVNDATPLLYYSSSSHHTGNKRAHRLITIEPVTFLESVSYGITLALRPQFLQDRIGEDKYHYTGHNDSQNGTCSYNSTNSTDSDIVDRIQADASLWIMYLSICSYFPALLATTILGTLSDSLGRKLALVIPVVGFIIQNGTFLFVLYFNLPLWVLLVGEVVQGCTGGVALLICGSLSYIADITTLSERTWRIVIVEMTLFVGSGIVQIVNGYLLHYLGYKVPVWISVGLLVITLLYIITPHILFETVERKNVRPTFLTKVLHDALALLKNNAGQRRWKLLILNIQIVVIDMATISFFSILILYVLAYPFCWSPILVGYITATSFLTTGIGMILGAKIFALCLSDYWILQIACVSAIVSMVLTGLAFSTSMIFIATALGSLRTLATPMVRSTMSKLVAAEEQGVMFAFQNSVENIGVFLSPIVLNAVYAGTVSTSPATTFYIIAALHVIPMVFTGALQIMESTEVKAANRPSLPESSDK